MIQKEVRAPDGVKLKYALSGADESLPWLALLIPFGLEASIATPFFDFFGSHYRIVTLESRSILEDSDRIGDVQEFSLENHVQDLRTVLDNCHVARSTLIGYCSGAGIAMGAAIRYPDLFDRLILVHGEYTLLGDPECTTQFALEVDSLLSMASKDERHASLVFDKIRDQRLPGNDVRPAGLDRPFRDLTCFRRYARNYIAYKSTDFESLARYVPHRTFLMSGARDAQANAASTRRIQKALSNSQIHVDPQADHYGILREESDTLVTLWNHLCE